MKKAYAGIKLAIIAALILSFSGCMLALTSVKKEAFTPGKKYALVTISTYETIQSRDQQGSSIAGWIKAGSSEAGYSEAANKIFNDSYPLMIEELGKSKNFTLVSGKKVLQSKAYKSIEGDKPEILWMDLLVPKGYKYFKEEQKLKDLAAKMNADGIIVMYVNYSFGTSGFNLAGLVKIGRQRAISQVSISALDKTGEVVWSDSIEQESEDYIGVIAESGNFEELTPMFKEASTTAVKNLVEKLATKI